MSDTNECGAILETGTEDSPQNPTLARVKQARTRMAQGAFLKAFQQIGTIKGAALAVGIDRSTHYDWMDNDPEYVEEFKHMDKIIVGDVEGKLLEVAISGDTQAIMFYLRCRKPEVYGDRQKIDHRFPEKLQLELVDKLIADSAKGGE